MQIQDVCFPCGWMCRVCQCIFSQTKPWATLQTPNRGLQVKLSNPGKYVVLPALAGLNALRQQAPRRLQRLWRIDVMDATGVVHRQRKRHVGLQQGACALVAGQGH